MNAMGTIGGADVLRHLAEDLDITHDQRALAEARYEDIGAWLAGNGMIPRDVRLYPQGSFRIGTTNRDPVTGEFDVDIVSRVDYAKDEISQRDLNEAVGEWLNAYHYARAAENNPLAPLEVVQKTRAWTLVYDNFHVDVLPVVPDGAGSDKSDPSWLTDKTLVRWQPTNPRGFATWFDATSADERQELRLSKAARQQVDVDDLPYTSVKTTLQLTVQLLKRHRDNFFGDDPGEVAPPSIVMTTLASRAYERYSTGGGDIDTVVKTVVNSMPEFIENRDGVVWIDNPVNKDENFADRYKDNPAKKEALDDWLDAAATAVGRITAPGGMDVVAKSIEASFGGGLGSRVAKRLGNEVQAARERGTLSSAAGALSVTGAGRAHPKHEFFGNPA